MAAWLQANGPGRFRLAGKVGWDASVNAAPRAELELLSREQAAALDPEELEECAEARMLWNASRLRGSGEVLATGRGPAGAQDDHERSPPSAPATGRRSGLRPVDPPPGGIDLRRACRDAEAAALDLLGARRSRRGHASPRS